MQFGVMFSSDDPRGTSPARRAAEHVERAWCALEAGFDTLAVAHRYSLGPAVADERGQPLSTARFQPLVLLAHVAGQIGDRMNYATQVLVSPGLHPVQLAEDIATLDALTGGRLRVAIGLGWMPNEFAAFGIDWDSRGQRLDELVILLRMLLTEEVVNFEGEHFTVRNATMVARCEQSPMPPLWLGASAGPAIRRAARLGDTWAMSAHTPLDQLITQQAGYHAELARLGKPRPAEQPLARLVYVAKDRKSALREAEPALAEWYRKRGEWGWSLTNGPHHGGPGDQSLDDIVRAGRWVIGDPDDCIEQISMYRDQLGADHLIFAMPWPAAAHRQRLETIELLGERVLPAFRAQTAGNDGHTSCNGHTSCKGDKS
jgi:alkanesulfonate monooxygenase SsuD/methylene tetrahydromethanopterin reductase-like flavin-dependent oxidoreductase (luciferase family)